ncbi:MAG: DUF4040 domain-containing protein [Lachnospiraceae bacterium]|nr:DUF4040 domain-containing protein [Lachnospiraceae bacterium]
MNYIEIALLGLVVICGMSACLSRNLMVALIIFMAYSVIMSIIWALLQAPDLAVTEAAVGAGVSSVLMFLTLKKLRDISRETKKELAEGEPGKELNGTEKEGGTE